MENGFTLKGYWWLPSQPDKKIAGELTYSPGKSLILEIQGSFYDEDISLDADKFTNQQVVLGTGNKGKAITLIDCHMIHVGHSMGPDGYHIQVQKFMAQQCFEGYFHFLSGEVVVSSVIVEFTNLDEWAGFRPIIMTKYAKDSFEFRYDRPQTIHSEIEGFSIHLCNNHSIRSSVGEIHISYTTYFEIASKAKCEINQFIQIIRELQNFLSFAVGQPVFPKSVKLITSDNNEGADPLPPIDFYYIPARYHPGDPPLPYFEMLFCLSDIEEKYSEIFDKWHELSEVLKPVFDVFFSMMFEREAYSENRFLSIIQVLEAYHRRMFGGKFLSDEDYLGGLYKELVAVLPEGLDKQFDTSLRDGKLKYANEYSLRKRLGEMVDIVGSEIPFVFLSTKTEVTALIRKVVNSRNQLTHFPKDNLTPIKGVELYELTTKLTTLFTTLLLHDCGFSWEGVRKVLEKNRKLKHLLLPTASLPLAK